MHTALACAANVYACLHPVALALRFEGLGGELLNRLTALNGGELDPSAQRRRDADAEHHGLIAEPRRAQTIGARRDWPIGSGSESIPDRCRRSLR